jgi:hypothetical protein
MSGYLSVPLQPVTHPVAQAHAAVVGAVQQVRCTNCGGRDWLAIVIAGVALIVSLGALTISLREHRFFLKQLRARARLKLMLRVLDHPDGVVVANAQNVAVRLEVGVTNYEGDKAASAATMNVVVPRWVLDFRWSGPGGEQVLPPGIPAATEELLQGDLAQPGQWIGQELPRVSVKTAYVRHCNLTVRKPDDADEVICPVRAKVGSDDLPDDVDEVVEETIIRFRWEPPPAL